MRRDSSVIHKPRRERLRLRAKCRNCGAGVKGRYCSECGQKITAGSERTLREIIVNVADSLFSWDSKIFVTLKYLLFFPGRLTRDYFDGKIARYAHPAKLFWFLTLIFFAFIILPQLNSRESSEKNTNLQISVDTEDANGVRRPAGSSEGTETKERPGPLDKDGGESVNSDGQTDNAGADRSTAINALLKSYLPYSVFLLIPFFALLLYMFFFRRQRYYAGHVVFALHFHSFVYVMALIIIVLSMLVRAKWLYWLYVIIPAIYFIAALRVAYGASFKRMWLIVPLIMFIYVVAMAILLASYTLMVMAVNDLGLLGPVNIKFAY